MSSGFDDRAEVAARFGVAAAQVERDFLISLVLAHLGERYADRLLFIGDTALARTHLPEGRLSEDIDLIALGKRTEIADQLTRELPRAVLRRFGRLKWRPSLSEVTGSDAAYLMSEDEDVVLKIQLLSQIGMPSWPAESRQLVQRYRESPAAALRVPTLSAFVPRKRWRGVIAALPGTCGICGRWRIFERSTVVLPNCSAGMGRPTRCRSHGNSPPHRANSSGVPSWPARLV